MNLNAPPEWLPGVDARTLMQMRARDLGWLADIVVSMLHGDPYQEGAIALDILEEYRKHIPAGTIEARTT